MMLRKGFSQIQVAAVLAVLIGGIGALVVFYPVHSPCGERTPSSFCQSNLRLLGLAFYQYRDDYDDKFPPVVSGKKGWVDLLLPYNKQARIFECPSVKRTFKGKTTLRSDYTYNARLAGVDEKKLVNLSWTILNLEGWGNDSRMANLASLPKIWTIDTKSPLYRHKGGSNYLFADGHVKWSTPAIISQNLITSNNSAFLYESESAEKPKPKQR